MRRPSPLDFLIGHAFTMLALLGGMVLFGREYLAGQEDRIVFLLIDGFLLLWSNAARSRVKAWRDHVREWQEVEGRPQRALPRSRRQLPRPLRTVLRIAALLLIVFGLPSAILFGWSFAQGIGVALPPIFTVIPEPLLTYPFHAWHWVEGMSQLSAPDVPRSDAILAAAVLFALACAGFVLWRGLRRLTRRTPRYAGKWDGTVQVMLPIPKARD